MAHVMMPGFSSERDQNVKTDSAVDFIGVLIRQMVALGARKTRICTCLVGGANVLGEGHENPGPGVIESVTGILDRQGIGIGASHVGGMEYKSCMLDVDHGLVTYTIGDSGPQVLWDAEAEE
jgi:chemotaxis receptor (MCP) glutamine deamidase CheD